MNKAFFKYGLITGVILSIICAISFYFLFLIAPKVDITKMNLVDLDGKKVNTELLLDKPLVINYWATWCKPSIEEMQYFEEINIKYKNDVNFLFVSDEEISKIANFNKRKKFNLFFVKTLENLSKNGLNIRPTTCFFKENGVVENVVTGGMTKLDLDKNLKTILEK